jgi:hypothetical protein
LLYDLYLQQMLYLLQLLYLLQQLYQLQLLYLLEVAGTQLEGETAGQGNF